MAISSAQQSTLFKVFTGMFDAALGGYYGELASYIDAGMPPRDLAGSMAKSNLFKSIYPEVSGSSTDFADVFLTNLLGSSFKSTNATDFANDKAWLASQITKEGAGQAIFDYLVKLDGVSTSNATYGSAKASWETKVANAMMYTGSSTNIAELQNALDADPATHNLSSSLDNLIGSSANDTFTGSLDGNNNTLTSGDKISGGTGTDTLSVTLGNASDFAILATTSGIETVKIQAQSTDATGSQGDTDSNAGHVRIDAEDMSGVSKWTNVDSRATLDIEDIRINSHITTLEWKNADPGVNVDYNVYFNPQNITAPGSSDANSSLTLKLANVLNIKEGTNPIEGFQSVVFKVGATTVTADLTGATTYAAVKTAIESALTTAGISNVTVTLAAAENTYFSTPVKTYLATELAGTYNPIVITNTSSGELTAVSINQTEGNTSGNVVKDISATPASSTPYLTQVDVILDNVGMGSKSGDFMAGSMSTGAYSGSKGIQQFNVTVENNSKLNSMSSTNDTLEVVNVVNGTVKGSLNMTGTNLANATAGTIVTADYGLTDVRVFDASAMQGAVTLDALLTSGVTAKYMNLVDTAAVTADNSEIAYRNVVDTQFSYDTGSGNDTLDLMLSGDNLNYAGTTTREDFVLAINTNAGNDNVTFDIDKDATIDTVTWYENSVENANLSINTADGNDTVRVKGAGKVAVDVGTGNDLVYIDNSGTFARWTVNAGAVPVDGNLNSDGKGATHFLYKGKLTVAFSSGVEGITQGSSVALTNGFETTIDIATTGSNYSVSQQEINQAIKKAINEDAVLKTLVAKDGPANTVVIGSLIDGFFDANDLAITVSAAAATSYTATEQTTIIEAYKAFSANSAATIAMVDTEITAATTDFNNNNGMTTGVVLATGADSTNVNDSTIKVGAGDDIVVLSTGDNSNNTITYEGYSQGKDTIVNFNTAGTGADTLNFNSYLVDKISLSGSTTSETTLVRTTNADATVEANSTTTTILFTANAAGTQTFASLSEANFLAAINSTNASNANDYGSIGAATLNAANTYVSQTTGAKTLVGGTGHAVVMVENAANRGEYKVFELTFDGTATNTNADFTAAKYIATVDVGNSLAAAVGGGAAAIPVTGNLTAVNGVAEVFTYNINSTAAGVAVSTAGGDWTITGFNPTEDSIIFNDAGTFVTKATFLTDVTVSSSAINNKTDIIFDANSSGVANMLTLGGVVDGSLSTVNFSIA